MAVPLKHKHPHVCGIQVRGGKLSARDGIASIQLKSRSACPQDMLLVLELGAAAPLQAVIQELEIEKKKKKGKGYALGRGLRKLTGY